MTETPDARADPSGDAGSVGMPATAGATLDHADTETVELVLPARSSYVSVLRTTTAALAARLDFTIDAIEDLRIGVDEACAILLAQANTGAQVHARFGLAPTLFEVTVSVPSQDARVPSRDSFAWTVLTALVDSVDTRASEDGHLIVQLTKRPEEL